MQALCQWEVQGDDGGETLGQFLAEQEVPTDAKRYAVKLFEQYQTHRQEIDDRIASSADRWQLSRISPVERNIMRVAVAEWTAGGVPPIVVLDEAIELGREFGGADSPRFINGVLDRILKRMLEEKGAQP